MSQVSTQPSPSRTESAGQLDILHLLPIVASYWIYYVTVSRVALQNFKHIFRFNNREHIVQPHEVGCTQLCSPQQILCQKNQ